MDQSCPQTLKKNVRQKKKRKRVIFFIYSIKDLSRKKKTKRKMTPPAQTTIHTSVDIYSSTILKCKWENVLKVNLKVFHDSFFLFLSFLKFYITAFMWQLYFFPPKTHQELGYETCQHNLQSSIGLLEKIWAVQSIFKRAVDTCKSSKDVIGHYCNNYKKHNHTWILLLAQHLRYPIRL